MRISTIHVSSVMLKLKHLTIRNVMTVKINPSKIPQKQTAMKWSQIRGRIEFRNEFIQSIYLLTAKSISVFSSAEVQNCITAHIY
jgi:hypothetical protein